MSTFGFQNITCPLCKEPHIANVMMSSNQLGSPDPDLRPAPMIRYTMDTWVVTCPHCGYVMEPHDKGEAGVDASFLASEDYRTTEGIPFQDALATSFYRLAMIRIASGASDDAILFALRGAAWRSDDVRDATAAAHCRRRALPYLERLGRGRRGESYALIHADFLRRLGEFDAAIALIERRTFHGRDAREKNAARRYEVKLARLGDTARHTIAEACRDAGDLPEE